MNLILRVGKLHLASGQEIPERVLVGVGAQARAPARSALSFPLLEEATTELPKLFNRYWEWFTVRILRIKSLKGEREELSRDQVSIFR